MMKIHKKAPSFTGNRGSVDAKGAEKQKMRNETLPSWVMKMKCRTNYILPLLISRRISSKAHFDKTPVLHLIIRIIIAQVGIAKS